VVACLYLGPDVNGRWWALAVYVSACFTDWLDGYLARAWHQQSTLGRMLDPIADKLLVGATLLMLTHDSTIDGPQIWAAVIILCREILVSGLREFLAELNVKVHRHQLKWKTTLQRSRSESRPAGDQLVSGVTSDRPGAAVGLGAADIVDGFDYLKAASARLSSARQTACGFAMAVKVLYFAWVRRRSAR
jgi:CDP-diacylglycerol--glycerol-3-phosphate 3-phosphatidyltransferase/cardiolipin synthase